MKGNQKLLNKQVSSSYITGKPLIFPYQSRSNSRDNRDSSRHRSPSTLYFMSYNVTLKNTNHHHLRKDGNTPLRVALHTLKMNWIDYAEILKFSMKNTPLQCTIILINNEHLLPLPLFMNAMICLDSHRKPNFKSLHLHTLQPHNKSAHVVYHFQKNLSRMNLTIRKSQRSSF